MTDSRNCRCPSNEKPMTRWLRRIGLMFIGLSVLGVSFGFAFEEIGRRHANRDFPPPGEMIDIGGRRISLDCRGTGTPTVIFESGLDIHGSLSWSLVHDEIARSTRACAYSRAGIMWSDPRDQPQTTGKMIANDLHQVLLTAHEPPPYILVGHSLGGPYIMIYTKYFPSDVAGLVFVDASHPDQFERFDAAQVSPKNRPSLSFYKAGAALARIGIVRVVAPVLARSARRRGLLQNQPGQVIDAVLAFAPISLGSMLKENEALDQTLLEAGTFRQLGYRPVFVLTAMAPQSEAELAQFGMTPEEGRRRQEVWKSLHDDQAKWTSQGEHQLIPDAHHYVQFDRPDLVIAAVLSILDKVRKK